MTQTILRLLGWPGGAGHWISGSGARLLKRVVYLIVRLPEARAWTSSESVRSSLQKYLV